MAQAARAFAAGPTTLDAEGRRWTETLIISDVHLGLRTSRPDKLLETLRSWRFNRLILLGDIFHDGRCQRFCADSWELVAFVQRLVQDQASEVVWLHGNHDRHLAPIIRSLTGAQIVDSFAWTENGQTFLAIHGDRFDWFNHNFHLLGSAIGRIYGTALHYLGRRDGWLAALDRLHGKLSGLHREVARKAAAFAMAQGVDVIVCGHTHRAAKRRFRDRERGSAVTYVNAGSWVASPASFLTVDGSSVRINRAW
jgi:UDP-2,3-diacylglucosamine pyrophosphatase LpxH